MQYPHCDSQILHREGACAYCDQHPEWQQLREMWGINFTGESDSNKIPCPSTRRRSLDDVHAWSGNQPKAPEAPEVPPVDRTALCTVGEAISPGVPNRELRPDGQHKGYVILCDEERQKGFVRPVRRSYRHEKCGGVTTMGQALAETYARDPSFYGSTFCVECGAHFPVGAGGEFTWRNTDLKVGT
jgi:hypothetical protein